ARRPLMTLLICALAAMASYLPMAILNQKYCGDWTGLAPEYPQSHKGEPLLRVAANTVHIILENLTPPVFPFANSWNRVVENMIPLPLKSRLEQNFEPGGAHLGVEEMQMEEGAGIGFGVTLLLTASVAAGFWSRAKIPRA